MNRHYNLSLKIAESLPTSFRRSTLVFAFFTGDENKEENLKNLLARLSLKIESSVKKQLLEKPDAQITIHNSGDLTGYNIIKTKAPNKINADYFRDIFAGILRTCKASLMEEVVIVLPAGEEFTEILGTSEYCYTTCIEGLYYGNYIYKKFKSDNKPPKQLKISLVANDKNALKKAIENTIKVMEAVEFTRDLQNEPGLTMTPAILAETIRLRLKKSGASVTILKEKEIKAKKMGGIIAIGMGSKNPPRFIVINYSPKTSGRKKLPVIALVGKGVTFDTGGISIKPAADMWEMKGDMSGAAVVAGVIMAAAELQLPVKLIGIIPSVENMPSGSAIKPGDIVVTSSGKTIEIDNTDAEGRVILADALHYASNKKPDVIIDLATLTGACVVALGEFVAGLFTKNDELSEKLFQSGLKTFDRVWPMPMWDEFNKLISSDVADVKNVGGRWGGAITAAKFLENWVSEDIPWAHLDIAGPSMPHSMSSYTRPFMTGFGVRLLTDFIKNYQTKK